MINNDSEPPLALDQLIASRIRWMLALSPLERLRVLQAQAGPIAERMGPCGRARWEGGRDCELAKLAGKWEPLDVREILLGPE